MTEEAVMATTVIASNSSGSVSVVIRAMVAVLSKRQFQAHSCLV